MLALMEEMLSWGQHSSNDNEIEEAIYTEVRNPPRSFFKVGIHAIIERAS